jgi:hypothetical protein
MVSARKLVYDFVRKASALNTNAGQSYSIIDVVSILNEAWEIVYENNIRMAEMDRRYHNNLRQLEVKNRKLEVVKVSPGIYLAKYPENLYKRLNQVTIAKCDGCESKRIVPTIVQADDLHTSRGDTFREANFPWSQLPATESGEGLYLYTDGEMEIEEVYIDYYRKINYIQAPSLVECQGQEYEDYDQKLIVHDVPFDVSNTYLARKVVGVALVLATADTKDPEKFQLQIQSIISLENIA